ncbi:MAG: hypothetical protein E3J47_00475 [Candidatus Stahlbacteria bacterium]|nr:MAG: hypothetical protein E3J47_00475 [Candidatus Stahlbacteria bacterium]
MKILIVRPWGKTAFELGGYCKNAFTEIGHNADLFTYNDKRISSRLPFLGFGCISDLHKKIQLSEEEYKKYGSDVCFAGTVSEGRIKVLEELISFIRKEKT